MVKNNNPGNIRLIKKKDGSFSAPFVGEIRPGDIKPGAAAGFRKFDSLINGFRAMFVLLKAGYINNGYDTIAKILPRYAPSGDNNNPESYINTVEQLSGVDRDTVLNTYGDLLPVVKAMARVETGTNVSGAETALNTIYNPELVVVAPNPESSGNSTKFNYKKLILPVAAIAALYIYEKKILY